MKMCKFIIKHFWNEEAKATITPSWVSSSDKNLNQEQEEVKSIAKAIFKDYIKIAREKPEILKFGDYIVKLSYKTKKDPDPTRNRMVTDITLCINKKFNKKPFFITGISILILGIIGFFINFKSNESHKPKNIQQTKKIEHKEIKQSNIEKQKKEINKFDEKYSSICKIPFNKIEQQKCYAIFIKNKCKNQNLTLSYDNWLNNNDYQTCKWVTNLKTDDDFNDFIKNKSNKYKIIQFMKGK